MKKVLVFAERMLPSTQTFIPIQVRSLQNFAPRYIGLIPATPSYSLPHQPILLTERRNPLSRARRELYRWFGIARNFHARARAEAPDLLHAHFAEGATAAVAISNACDVPLIVHLRGGAEMQRDSVLRQRLYQWPYLLWRNRLWKRASLFLCVSEFIRQKALVAGFPADKLRVHYTGIDFRFFAPTQPAPERDRSLVLYVGRLVEYKGADHLVRAMSIVRKTEKDARLLLIGDGPFRPQVHALARELDVPCEFLGEQPATIVRSWMERARVFCAPSMTLADGMSEAFGNVFTEAQAMGLPVVSYRHGGISETMLDGQTGILADEYDYAGLAGGLLRYLQDDQFWAASHQQGRIWVREFFDVYKQTEKLEQTYAEVLARYQRRVPEPAPEPLRRASNS